MYCPKTIGRIKMTIERGVRTLTRMPVSEIQPRADWIRTPPKYLKQSLGFCKDPVSQEKIL